MGSNKFKTKIRRLYDVSKVLITIGVIKQVQENKRSVLEWVGLDEMKEKIIKIVQNSKKIDLKNNFCAKAASQNLNFRAIKLKEERNLKKFEDQDLLGKRLRMSYYEQLEIEKF